MKTPEEIKKGLECCMHEGECKRCPYQGEKCTITASGDALALIQQLEERIVDLNKTSEQLKRERDMAIEDMQTGVCCETCVYVDTDVDDQPCATCADAYVYGNWQWRGVQEVE